MKRSGTPATKGIVIAIKAAANEAMDFNFRCLSSQGGRYHRQTDTIEQSRGQ